MIEKERWVPEKSIMVRTECQDSAEAMRVERVRKVEAEQRADVEEAVRMEAERRSTAMKAERQAAAVELAFQISVWL